VADAALQQASGGAHRDGLVGPGVDDCVPGVVTEGRGHRIGIEPVGVPRLRARGRRSAVPSVQRGDLVAAGQGLLDERAADVVGPSEDEQSHAGHPGVRAKPGPAIPLAADELSPPAAGCRST
jgi:hypothetical protein